VVSLYEDGWRQGSRLTASLPNDTVVLNTANEPSRDLKEHDRWVVTTQDCDLAYSDPSNAEPTIELHPVFQHDPDPNTDWGIRSRRFVLSEAEHVVSPSPHTLVSAAVLTVVGSSPGSRAEPLPEYRAVAFKRWLGYRYDRPAVPDQLVGLAERVAKEVQRNRRRLMGTRVRDVLMQFDEARHPPRFSLFAVIQDAADEQGVREWLADIALSVPKDLGIGDEFVAVTSRQISLHLIETSYAADVTQLTWRGSTPEGAF
jgi:hypothetical protein